MKKLFFVFALLSSFCCYAQSVHSGEATVKDGTTQVWVQLWRGGPKWAMFNVGSTISSYADAHFSEAKKQEKYSTKNIGGHYTWGGVVDCGYSDAASNHTVLVGENDTAVQLWGDKWRMPTSAELCKLQEECVWEWMDGINKQYIDRCTLPGFKITGKGEFSRDSIFLPASGWCLSGKLYDVGICGYIWSSECSDALHSFSDFISFGNKSKEIDSAVYDRYAFTVRAVLAK